MTTTFKDLTSENLLCAKIDDPIIKNGTPHFEFNRWCEQFVTTNSVFVDTCGGIGILPLMMSRRCKEVLCESESPKCLINTANINKMNNIKMGIDIFPDNVDFIRLTRKIDPDLLKFTGYCPVVIPYELQMWIEGIGYETDILPKRMEYLICTHPDSKKNQIRKDNNTYLDMISAAQKLVSQSRYYEAHHMLTDANQLYPTTPYSYLTDEMKTMYAHYIGDKSLGMQSCENIIMSYDHGFGSRNKAMDTYKFYSTPIKYTQRTNILFETPQNYVQTSSSMIKTGNSYLMNVRVVNYTIADNGSYIIRDPHNIVRTRNFLVFLGKELYTISVVELIDESGIKLLDNPRICGLEDVRLIDDESLFCTRVDVNGTPSIFHCLFKKNGVITNCKHINMGGPLRCEKNWMPFKCDENKLHFIYTCDPLVLCQLENNNVTRVIESNMSSLRVDEFRGSAPPIRYNDGWLFTVHQVHHAGKRKYYHRLVWTKEFKEYKYSKLFTFETPNIEFNLSICYNGFEILMVYSVEDTGTHIAHVSNSTVHKMLFD